MNVSADLIDVDGRPGAAGDRNLVAKDTLVGTAGMGQEDGDDKGAVAGCRVLDAGCSMLVRRVD